MHVLKERIDSNLMLPIIVDARHNIFQFTAAACSVICLFVNTLIQYH